MARLNIFSIPSDASFLEVLARAVLQGFPRPLSSPPSPLDIARTTILVPTRRAARDLERVFFEVCGKAALLLPRIRPLGDIDEELFGESLESAPSMTGAELPGAISPLGRDLILIELIGEWAKMNPQERLAQEIAASPRQTITLAASLAEFADSLDTEDIDPARLADLYGIEAARHRESILSFLALIRERLPAKLRDRGLLGPKARRSVLLRREAVRLADHPPPWPVMAAGSTGSIPAARELLAAIAALPNGAIILPGLDTLMEEESWLELGPQHPQFIMKQFLEDVSVPRNEVALLPGHGPGARSWLAGEIMRPTATSESWLPVVRTQIESISRALADLEAVEARDVSEEASVIALMFRKALTVPGKTASLVTPDRELARRVKQELADCGIEIDDSAGEPLIRIGAATFLGLLIDAVAGECAPQKLLALFKHELCNFGFDADAARNAVSTIELAVFRGSFIPPHPAELAKSVSDARNLIRLSSHVHPAIARKTEADWKVAADYAEKVSECVVPLVEAGDRPLAMHLDMLVRSCELAAGPAFWEGEEAEPLRLLVEDIQREAGTIASCSFKSAAFFLWHRLQVTPFRGRARPPTRLSILGLLEARLSRPDVVILGGLNEGRWPASPDSGPWLSRPMREKLGMQLPERNIGQTAHDFAQGLGCREAYLTWSRRIGNAPAIPSRWILRLRMLVKAAGLIGRLETGQWQSLAALLHDPGPVTPCARPRPTPPLSARPKHITVTKVETLIRDPYAFYAEQILGLRPLDETGAPPTFASRGVLFHQVIADFLKEFPESLSPGAAQYLLQRGQHHFAPLIAHSDVQTFWWPQFLRIAEWLASEELRQRQGVERVYSEISGRLEFPVNGEPFTLISRADRIDVFSDGSARITDYKTGTAPSAPQVAAGLAPQLTLQCAILEKGGFVPLGPLQAREISYVKLSGGNPAGEVLPLNLKAPLIECARTHLAYLIALLTAYADHSRPYLPRILMEKEDEPGGYDHLSRYREWALSKAGP